MSHTKLMSESQLPPFEDRPRTVAALRRVAELLQEDGISETRQVELYNQFIGIDETEAGGKGKGKQKAINNAGLNKGRFNEFTNGASIPHPRDIVLPQLWRFYATVYPSSLLIAWKQTVGHDIALNDPLACTIHNFLSPDKGELSDAPYRFDRVVEFGGHYTLYRPFYANPDHEIMVMALTCGVDDNATRFRLDMRFPLLSDDPDEIEHETAEGSIIPYLDRVLLFGKIESRGAPVIISLTENSMRHDSVRTLDGVMMVCSAGHRASAYPIYGVRSKEPTTPCVVNRSELQAMSRLWSFLEKPMSRGIVDWRG
ncbi:MAG: hypothetical protein KGR68_17760 [Betaproteobacteria bacterium]|nr:hypothetical protein [Betaproteobacteria bacterium]